MNSQQDHDYRLHIDEFSDIWNAIISSLRDEDLISNRFAFGISLSFPFHGMLNSKVVFPIVYREMNLMIVPSSMGDISVFQWPPFLLALKVRSFRHTLIDLLNFLP